MNKELPMYHIYEDGDGHRYLIPKDEVDMFYSVLDDLLVALDEHLNEDIYCDELDMTLEAFDRLEGEEYFVVLAEDLK